MIKTKRFLIYKIYYSTEAGGNELVYIGRTDQPLNSRLQGHFFKAPMMQELDINRVSHIECAAFQTAADMYAMEVIMINRYKPKLNQSSKTRDELTIDFPYVPFSPFKCPHLERWRNEILEQIQSREEAKNERVKLLQEHREKRREIFSSRDLSPDDKSKQWAKWLVEYYEPAMEAIAHKEEIGVCQG